ncbi:MAG: hypothetical protein KGD59_08615 [Candidatus Heimdallarchaeota archaeon]|nr:hypothetical protein [Candidatus Heimdallarchaeota archaeon]MBY8994599.1 hypothetical protein [Candidatus Heimdallarchaeota archaeon]
MSEYFKFFFVKAVGNGSLFVGPKYSVLEESKEKEELMSLAHKTLTEAAIDVSRVMHDEDYGELRFYINNKLEKALEILHEIDDEF